MMPEQDAVLIITSESQDLPDDLNQVWKNLLPAFGLITVEHIKNSVSQLLAVESRFMQRTSISNLQNWKSKLHELSSSEPVILIGAGNGAIQVLDILVKINKYNPVGYFSDEPENILDSLEIMNYGNTSVENISEIAKRLEVKKLIITVALSPLFRYNCSMLDGLNGLELVTLIHPDTIIGTNVEIGAGTVIFGNVHIGAETKIGKACFISSGSTIEHHNSIGAGFCCGPMFATSGLVTIGEKTKAGMGVCIEPGINIGNEVILASKTLITKNIADGVTVKSIF
jgi:acetyltransferase-like isoleucine patch superfamily enzyme